MMAYASNKRSSAPFRELSKEISEILRFDPNARLDRVRLFDITIDQQYFAILDFNYVLHVYKTKLDSNEFEEVAFSKIYDSSSKSGLIPDQKHSKTTAKGMRIPMGSNLPPNSLIHLSISDTGKYVVLSILIDRIKFTWINIYSTEPIEQLQETPTPNLMDVSKKFRYARPMFSSNGMLLVTDGHICLFNLNFELTWRTKSFLFGDHRLPHASYGSASSNFSALQSPELGNERELSYCTKFIRRNVLIEICDDHIQRLWLPGNNKPIASIKLETTESIIAISENYNYAATFEKGFGKLRVYSTKTGLVVHKMELGEDFFQRYDIGPDNRELIIDDASFQFNDKMLLFSGYVYQMTSLYNPNAAKEGRAFTELWSIPVQIPIFHRKHKIQTDKMKRPIIFVTPHKTDQLLVTYINSNRHYLLEREYFSISIREDGIPIQQFCASNMCEEYEPSVVLPRPMGYTTGAPIQQVSTTHIWKEWEPRGAPRISLEHTTGIDLQNDIVFDLDSPKNQLKRFTLNYNSNRYILFFGCFSVQMWRLEPIEDNSEDNDDVFKSILTPGSKSDTLYYRYTNKSELVYIKFYRKVIDNMHELSEKNGLSGLAPDIDVEINITEIPGHTIIRQKTSGHINANSYFDELILPMEGLIHDTSGTSICDDGNSNNSDSQSDKTPVLQIDQLSQNLNNIEFKYFESIIHSLFYLQSIIDKDTVRRYTNKYIHIPFRNKFNEFRAIKLPNIYVIKQNQFLTTYSRNTNTQITFPQSQAATLFTFYQMHLGAVIISRKF
jgi:hypothetical protein